MPVVMEEIRLTCDMCGKKLDWKKDLLHVHRGMPGRDFIVGCHDCELKGLDEMFGAWVRARLSGRKDVGELRSELVRVWREGLGERVPECWGEEVKNVE